MNCGREGRGERGREGESGGKGREGRKRGLGLGLTRALTKMTHGCTCNKTKETKNQLATQLFMHLLLHRSPKSSLSAASGIIMTCVHQVVGHAQHPPSPHCTHHNLHQHTAPPIFHLSTPTCDSYSLYAW